MDKCKVINGKQHYCDEALMLMESLPKTAQLLTHCIFCNEEWPEPEKNCYDCGEKECQKPRAIRYDFEPCDSWEQDLERGPYGVRR